MTTENPEKKEKKTVSEEASPSVTKRYEPKENKGIFAKIKSIFKN